MDEDRAPGWGPPGTPLDRILHRIGHFRTLPPPAGPCPTPALGPPSPDVDTSAELREPPVDVVCTPRRVYVTVEIPGAAREEIAIEATETTLRIRARCHDGRAYDREIELPDRVDPTAAEASYRNGVLDFTIPRRSAHRVRIRGGDVHGR